MLPFYTWEFVVTVAFAIFWYRAGVSESAPALLWTGLSVTISLLIWRWLHWGVLAMILGQLGLFVGIGVFRVCRKS
jgi:hypothetical protein